MSPRELEKLAAALGGLPVLGCRPDSPADRAGVLYGDIVIGVNGMATPDWAAFLKARQARQTSMTIELFRNGERLVLEVPLETCRLDPAELLAELIATRVVPLDRRKPSEPSEPN